MNRWVWIAVAFVVAALAGVAARLWIWPSSEAPRTEQSENGRPEAVAVTDELVLESADLYFPSLAGGLEVHRQDLPAGAPTERIRSLVQALIDGPGGATDGDLYGPLPAGAALGEVYFLRDGTVALDLRSRAPQSAEAPSGAENAGGDDAAEEDPRPEPVVSQAEAADLNMGSQDELAAVYSLVNTVTLNGVEGAERVVLLWDGRQPRTFAGHVDVSRPLTPDPSLAPTP